MAHTQPRVTPPRDPAIANPNDPRANEFSTPTTPVLVAKAKDPEVRKHGAKVDIADMSEAQGEEREESFRRRRLSTCGTQGNQSDALAEISLDGPGTPGTPGTPGSRSAGSPRSFKKNRRPSMSPDMDPTGALAYPPEYALNEKRHALSAEDIYLLIKLQVLFLPVRVNLPVILL